MCTVKETRGFTLKARENRSVTRLSLEIWSQEQRNRGGTWTDSASFLSLAPKSGECLHQLRFLPAIRRVRSKSIWERLHGSPLTAVSTCLSGRVLTCLPLCTYIMVAFSLFPSNLEGSADGSRRDGFTLRIFLFRVGPFWFVLFFSSALDWVWSVWACSRPVWQWGLLPCDLS